MKKSLTVIISACMASTLLTGAALGAASPKSSVDFNDLGQLDAGTRAKFDAMIAARIFDGVSEGAFGLHDKMNRAQFAKAAAMIFNLKVDTLSSTSSFRDVSAADPANGYALPYIEALKKANLTDGFGEGTYNPAGEVTKEQLAAFLIRGLNKEAEVKQDAAMNDSTVSSWAKGYVALAVQMNLMGNQTDGKFGGMTPANRELLVTSSYEAKRLYVPVTPAVAEIPVEDMKAFNLTENTQAQVKSVTQEKSAEGWRVGVVVTLNNTSGFTNRIPDYELRIQTAEGTVYTLQASASNSRSIPPQGNVTLSYMTDIGVNKDIQLTNLLWVDVNQKVYPKVETQLADAAISSIVWRGQDAKIDDPSRLGDWGARFSLPGIHSDLKYSAVKLSKQFTGQTPSYIVEIQAENEGSYAETIPDFTLSGKSEGQSFIGKRVEETPIRLDAGARKSIHFAITTDMNTTLQAFYVLSPESFLKQGQTVPIPYFTGRIGFRLPANEGTVTGPAAGIYIYGTPIAFTPRNDFINPNLTISLEELHVTDNEETGNKTGVAKFKLFNKSDKPIPVPAFGAELAGKDGNAYAGKRQIVSATDIEPGTGVVVSYGFTLPTTEQSERFQLNVQEVLSNSAYKSTIASYPVSVQNENDHNNISLFPFKLNLKNWTLSQLTAMGTTGFAYTYKLSLDMDMQRESEVVLDNAFSKLKFELVDSSGRSLGSNSFPFTGANRLVSGSQMLTFSNLTQDQVQSHISVKVYETITTPTGEVDRLIAELK
ncbi:S-layer homology domain-containing protein [Paenibacillus anseongense]|uniref:S-layer homology domain-containing protein n=1 Tax=Paenibacillus anseongense TaxID=2682845 RepID=UPI002DB8CE63|nr:S-layer homology domain-containing protein [Paenibacillus anseongense]MEC0265307.1 S-layer homology domain-containing protein [Paenibacillus anseongense]